MVKKLLYIFLIVMAGSLVFTGPADATKVRDLGLGVYDTPWMLDGLQSYIFENPAYLSKQDSQIYYVRSKTGEDDDNIYYSNSGGLVFTPMDGLNIGVFTGVTVDYDLWNSGNENMEEETNIGGFFHTGTYDIKANDYQPITGVNPSGDTISLLDPDGNSSTAASAEDYRERLDQQDVNIMASYVLDKMAFGLSLGYGATWSDDSFDQKTPDSRNDSWSFANTEISAILAWLFALTDDMSVDADVHYTQYILKNTYDASIPGAETNMAYESDGAIDLVINAGFKWDYTALHKLHSRIGFGILNHSAMGTGTATGNADPDDDFDVTEKYERQGTYISVGSCDEMRFTKDITVFVGFNVLLKTFEYKYSGSDANHAIEDVEEFSGSSSSIEVPLILGIESKISENWTARFSMVHNIWDPEEISDDLATDAETTYTESTDTTDQNTSQVTELNIGLSYQLGNLRFDWLANIDVFIEGPFIISGKSTTSPGKASTPVSMAFAASYLFDSGSASKTLTK